MPDPIRHDCLTDIKTLREAHALEFALTDIIDGHNERDEHAALMATAACFLDSCEYAEVDPLDALAQIWDAREQGLLTNQDDPAQGQFVHAEHSTRN